LESGALDVPNPAVAGSTTQECWGELPAGTPPEHARVVLVPGSGAIAADDLHRFLRQRLRVVCTMLAGLFFAMVSLSLIFSLSGFHPDLSVDLNEWFRRFW
jgi:hypothetical protein